VASSSEASVPSGAARAGTSQSTRLFVRQTSGLVRDLGIPAATGISLASVAVVNTFINFNAGLTDFAKADMYLPLVAGAVIWLTAMFAYRYLLRAVPRAGGEYVYLSRIVSPVAGSVAGLGIAVVFTYVLSTNAHFAAQFTPFMLSGLGSAFHSTAIANAGNHLTSNIAIAWISVIVMLIVAALSLFSVRIVARIIFWLIVLQVVAFVVLIGMLAVNSHADFVSALASYSHTPNAYGAIIAGAKANGVVFGTSIAAAVAIIPFMVLNYRADLLETPGMPDDARKKWLRNVALVGGATTLLALFTVFELVTHQSVYGKFQWESILTLVIVLGAGPVIYLIARSVRKQRDALDLDMAMRELPPE